ncbi:hypothetical protein BKA62DRAFT_652485 [Auriculariales sp. MPI-PUGE-AT-0066]|nr:hypothetical protein BKA62DRAFT_652485 [Auriculariales sp. MPI-PUGE-AT-0066]
MQPTLLRCSRSAWKGPFFVAFPNLREAAESNIPIFTRARSCTILPPFVGVRFQVHNGKSFVPVIVTPEMVGHKLGEFSPTRRRGKMLEPVSATRPTQKKKPGRV